MLLGMEIKGCAGALQVSRSCMCDAPLEELTTDINALHYDKYVLSFR